MLLSSLLMEKLEFYLKTEEPNKSCLLVLRDIILGQDAAVTETVKYSMPCFCYHKKMFCYLWVDKKTQQPYILFVEGNRLNHPDLKSEGRARMKVLHVDPESDIPIELIDELLDKALNLYRDGTIVIS